MVSVKEKDFWIEFIEKYRSFPCLWDVYSKDYSNKILREGALEMLVEKCKEINADANKDYVRKRIANLRTSFSREFKKIQNSKHTGCAADDTYQTTLWYYDNLLFLKDGEISREGTSSLSNSRAEETYIDEDIFLEDYFSPPHTPGGTSQVSTSRPSSSCSTQSRKKLTLAQQQTNFFEKASDFMAKKEDKEEDEFGILGKRIAAHFRNMESNQRLIAEKIISDVLIHGRMNQLTMNSAFVLKPPSSNIEMQSTSDFPENTIVVNADSFFPTVQMQTSSYNYPDAELSEFLQVRTNPYQNLNNKNYSQN